MQDYKYRGKSLTGVVASDLILELFDGQTDVPFKSIKEKVEAQHIHRGGLEQTSEKALPVTNGLGRLKRKDLANNPEKGYWTINRHGFKENLSVKPEKEEDILIVGEGESVVYLYYFPTYRSYAESTGKDSYPCKVGRTDGGVDIRINSQVETALPEEPVIGLIIQTDNPIGMEKQVHDLLDIAGFRKKDAPGKEWFVTNPDQVKSFYEACQKKV